MFHATIDFLIAQEVRNAQNLPIKLAILLEYISGLLVIFGKFVILLAIFLVTSTCQARVRWFRRQAAFICSLQLSKAGME